MRLFLDTEFNGFGGELISIALVSECGRAEWYAVLRCEEPTEWVAKHVIPVLGDAKTMGHRDAAQSMGKFLRPFNRIQVIADWPEDIKHFCDLLMSSPGQSVGLPASITMVIRCGLSPVSTTPHNALEDARALARAFRKATDA